MNDLLDLLKILLLKRQNNEKASTKNAFYKCHILSAYSIRIPFLFLKSGIY